MSQTTWPYVINLGNSIIGVSVLAMPYCFQQCGLLLGLLLILGSGLLARMSCGLLLKSAVASKKKSYEFLALHAFGPAGKLCVELSIIGLLIGTCIAFHVVIGDLGTGIFSEMLGLKNSAELRYCVMISIGIFVALPFGLLRNIESLSNISALTIGFYSVFVLHVLLTSLPNIWSGEWLSNVTLWQNSGIFKCLPIFSLAFCCQSQLFLMIESLPEPSLSKMNGIVSNAINLCLFVYLMVGYFGFVAFSNINISGDVLVNFAPSLLSSAMKLGFVLSVAVSFPLVIYPCRTSIYSLLFSTKLSSHSTNSYSSDEFSLPIHESSAGRIVIPDNYFRVITICIVFGTLITGIMFPNVEFILGFTGATMGSMICFIFPAVMFISIMKSNKPKSLTIAQVVLFIGMTIMLASTYVTLSTQDNKANIIHLEEKNEKENINHILTKKVDYGGDIITSQSIKQNKRSNLNDPIKVNTEDSIKNNAAVVLNEKRIEPPNPDEPAKDNPLEPAKDSDNRNEPSNLGESNKDIQVKSIKNNEKRIEQPNLDESAKDNQGEPIKNIEKRIEPPNPDEPIKGNPIEQVKNNIEIPKKSVDDTNVKEGIDKFSNTKFIIDGIEKKKVDNAYVPDGKLINKSKEIVDEERDKLELKKDKEEAKKLIKELSDQKEEQKKLINEQKEIIKQLKEHHEEHDQKNLEEQPLIIRKENEFPKVQQMNEQNKIISNAQQHRNIAVDTNNIKIPLSSNNLNIKSQNEIHDNVVKK